MLKSLAYVTQGPEGGAEIASRLHGIVLEHAQTFERSLRFMQRNVDGPKGAAFFRDVFSRDVREWKELSEKTRLKLEHLVTTFEVHPDLLERVRKDEPLDAVLAEVMRQVNAEASSGEAVRAHSPLIRFLMTTVDRNRKNLQGVEAELQEARNELARLRSRLGDEAAILFADAAPGSVYVEAQVYEAGTVITTSPELRHGVDGSLREVIGIQQPIVGTTRFVLEKSLLRRVEARLHPSVT
jgi:hypothetical protein